jgi:hypothetical protein
MLKLTFTWMRFRRQVCDAPQCHAGAEVASYARYVGKTTKMYLCVVHARNKFERAKAKGAFVTWVGVVSGGGAADGRSGVRARKDRDHLQRPARDRLQG